MIDLKTNKVTEISDDLNVSSLHSSLHFLQRHLLIYEILSIFHEKKKENLCQS